MRTETHYHEKGIRKSKPMWFDESGIFAEIPHRSNSTITITTPEGKVCITLIADDSWNVEYIQELPDGGGRIYYFSLFNSDQLGTAFLSKSPMGKSPRRRDVARISRKLRRRGRYLRLMFPEKVVPTTVKVCVYLTQQIVDEIEYFLGPNSVKLKQGLLRQSQRPYFFQPPRYPRPTTGGEP